MRLVLASVLVLLSGGAALASSITPVVGQRSNGVSIVGISCETCKAAHRPEKQKVSTYKVPELERGTQKVEIININGEKKLVRTEAWLGGSPVIHVGKLPAWMAEENAIASVHPTTNGSTERDIASVERNDDGIDTGTTASAVDESAKTGSTTVATVAEPQPLSLQGFQLRTN